MKRYITIRLADGGERQLSEADLPLRVGSDPDSHIPLPGGAAEAAHVGDAQGHLFIQPAAELEPPLFHNDRLCNASSWLKSGDELRCGRILISYERSGDRVRFTVTEPDIQAAAAAVRPPSGPPPGREELPVQTVERGAPAAAAKIAVGLTAGAFLLLGLAVLFVLTARPLHVRITPEPDSVSISGFPPVIRLGSRYLALPGTYQASVSKTGYVTYSGPLTIAGSGDTTFTLSLDKLPGLLRLSVTPPGPVSVFSGDRLLAATPPDVLEIAPGHHRLKLTRPRYQPFETEMQIEGEGREQVLEAELQPDWAEISLLSEPAGAAVTIDGRPVGTTPLSLDLLSGNHVMTFAMERYATAEEEIAVQAGNPVTHTVTLSWLPAELSLTSTPAAAAVTVDGAYRGGTPLIVSLSAQAEHEIVLTAPGYITARRSLSLAPGQKQELALNLEQEMGIIYLTTAPSDARVAVNGTVYPDAQGKLVLPAGPLTFEVTAPGYAPVTRTVVAKSGFSQQLAIELEPAGTSAGGDRASDVPAESAATTSAGQKLLLVRPAPFTMGAPRREPGRRANERERPVVMTRPFYLAEKPVTNREYRQFDSGHRAGTVGGHTLDGDTQPVVAISWEDAVRYLNWLSERDGLIPFYRPQGDSFVAASPPTSGYRLPTEAEWAFCARQTGGTNGQRFPWAGSFPPRSVSGNYADESAASFLPLILTGYHDGFPVTSPVASFPATGAGFYDLGGNVAEWCHDFYSAYTGALSREPDPFGPESGTHRVIRGSSWRDGSVTELRLSYRAYHREARDNVGFRIARYP